MACAAIVVRRCSSSKGRVQVTCLLNVLIGKSFISVGASIKPSGGFRTRCQVRTGQPASSRRRTKVDLQKAFFSFCSSAAGRFRDSIVLEVLSLVRSG